MPTLATITIKDGAATPVDHALAPVQSTGTLSSFRERVGVVAQQLALVVDVRPPVNGGQMYRVRVFMSQPKAVTVDGVVSVPYVNRANTEFLINEVASQQEIKDLFALHGNALANPSVADAVKKLEPFY